MTDLELKELVAGLATKQAETERLQADTWRLLRETARELRESGEAADRRLQETGREFDRRLQESKAEHDREMQELRDADRETDRQLREMGRKTDRQLRELGKQIGGLGEKFGTYTEGMASISIKKLLRERFRMSTVAMGLEVRRNGDVMQVDGLGYSNSGLDEVYMVEIKSRLRQDGLDQMLRNLRRFPDFFPEHRGKKLYGVLAAVDVPQELVSKVAAQGIYLARLGSVAELQVPDGFQPRSYQ